MILNRAYRRLAGCIRPTTRATATVRAANYWTRLDNQHPRGWTR